MARSIVPILATRELVVPLANNPIMLKRLIWLFKHLEQKIISDYICIYRWLQENAKKC